MNTMVVDIDTTTSTTSSSSSSSALLDKSPEYNVIANTHITLPTNLPLVGNKLNVNKLPAIMPSQISFRNAHETEEVCNTM